MKNVDFWESGKMFHYFSSMWQSLQVNSISNSPKIRFRSSLEIIRMDRSWWKSILMPMIANFAIFNNDLQILCLPWSKRSEFPFASDCTASSFLWSPSTTALVLWYSIIFLCNCFTTLLYYNYQCRNRILRKIHTKTGKYKVISIKLATSLGS